ncbi:DNA replication origin-binding helicase [Macropodid alphaherpesvirus 1]|uniref:Replication origin-binding protein n=1 Tax=Macropodid alphaherpesvirus 1 TaxID=137443 RepID=A0A109QI97_9ALPH|nr:DNA replication origin-binding helicase [Macropodid alphaherpesvirus 1]AMB17002.1 DNA replication origin-binding helicase [Macropodid alphaherpesvirus 1]
MHQIRQEVRLDTMPPDRGPVSVPAPSLRPITAHEQEQYASSVSLARMLYGGDLAEWIPTAHSKVTLDVQSHGPVSFPDASSATSRCVTIVRAPMGSGKTTALIRWLKEALHSPDTSVLVVSCRRSFTQTLAARFAASGLDDFVTYLSAPQYIMNDRPFHRLIVQIESLHRIGPNLSNNYDVLVLDEIMSTFGQLYSPTMQQLSRVDTQMMSLLQTCPRIIAMDATANAQLVDFFCSLRGDKNIHVVMGEYAMPGFSNRQCTFVPHLGHDILRATLKPGGEESGHAQDSTHGHSKNSVNPCSSTEGSFFSELKSRLDAGRNICIFSSTVSFSEIVFKFCQHLTDRALLLNSFTPPSDVSTWDQYRVVIYTTVVTVGLSFDRLHFDSMFAYVKPMNYGPDMVSVYQSLGRVRTLRNNEMFIYMDGSGARSEPIFTPMLLNHLVHTCGRWPAQFSQVANILCRKFKDKCDTSMRHDPGLQGSRLYAKFRYKHYFERCTLACLADSLNILHMLLTLNCMPVQFRGYTDITAQEFCAFLRTTHFDALKAQRDLRGLRGEGACVSLQAQITETEEVCMFVGKYMRPEVCPTDILALMRALNSVVNRTRFIHLVVLEACLRVPMATQSSAIFRRLYDHYATGVIPTIGAEGTIELVALHPTLQISRVYELFCLCSDIASHIKWDSSAGGSAVACSPDDILTLLRPHYDRYIQLIFEIGHYNITDTSLLSEDAVKKVADALRGCPPRGSVTETEHATTLFKLLWGELFGVQMTKSTQTFPGASRVKNLTKQAIIDLLDTHDIDHRAHTTYRQLYALLMQHKQRFSNTRFKLRAPTWGKYIRTHSTNNPLNADLILEAALAELPSDAWPMMHGALNFGDL